MNIYLGYNSIYIILKSRPSWTIYCLQIHSLTKSFKNQWNDYPRIQGMGYMFGGMERNVNKERHMGRF